MKAADIFEFKWGRDTKGYELLYLEGDAWRWKINPEGPDAGWVLRQKSGQLDYIEPLAYSTLYLRLVNASTNEKLRNFADAFGPLRFPDANESPIDSLQFWRDRMAEVVQAGPSRRRQILEHAVAPAIARGDSFWAFANNVVADLAFDETDRMCVRLRPENLQSAIWLQFAIDVEAGAEIRTCPQCANLFGVGPNTNHRMSAIYCSAKCQNAAAYARRKSKISG
jgi:hypothetical protein